jgi:anti-sigma factor RsiW
MSAVSQPIGEHDLHAYIDGQLDAERRSAVEHYLEDNPQATQLVSAYGAQREAVRQAFADYAAAPVPPTLSLAHIIAQRNRRPWQGWLVAASVVLALGIGLAGGWLLHVTPGAEPSQRALALLEQEALTSHAVYAPDQRHPVEVPGVEEPHLRQWLSNRLARTVVAPDLSALGYRLIGGRLLATERGGAAALLMYDDASGHRLSVLLRPMAPSLQARGTMMHGGGINGRAWIGNGMGIAVVAAMPESDIARLATQIGANLGTSG